MATDYIRKFKRYTKNFILKSLLYAVMLPVILVFFVFASLGVPIHLIIPFITVGLIISALLVLRLNKKRRNLNKEIEDAIDEGATDIKKYKTICFAAFLVPVIVFIIIFFNYYIMLF